MDLYAHSQPCPVQLDTAVDGLAGVAGLNLYCSDGCCSRWTCYLHMDIIFYYIYVKLDGMTIKF